MLFSHSFNVSYLFVDFDDEPLFKLIMLLTFLNSKYFIIFVVYQTISLLIMWFKCELIFVDCILLE